MDGWIRIHRKIQNWKFYFNEPFTRSQAWIDLILLANYKPVTIMINNIETTIERGEVSHSIAFMAKRWKWGERKTRTFLESLKKDDMITRKTKHQLCTVTIIKNYDFYNPMQEQTQGQAQEQTQPKYKKDKKVNKYLSKDKLAKATYGNEQVDFVLSLYQKYTGGLPTDDQPRRVAHNTVQITKTLIKDIRPHYPSDRIEELTPEFILNKAFEWYFDQLKEDVDVTRLVTVKKNIANRFYEATRRKYVPGYKFTPKS